MPECPYCGRWFRSKKGLSQHIGKIHKDSFGNINPLTFDPIGSIKRREERSRKRRKRKKAFFDIL
jgi:hypothetical protein